MRIFFSRKNANRIQSNAWVASAAVALRLLLTVGPGAVPQAQLVVSGIAASNRRQAALVSIDGEPAQWWARGETRDGLILESVSSRAATFRSRLGRREIPLGGEPQLASGPLVSQDAP